MKTETIFFISILISIIFSSINVGYALQIPEKGELYYSVINNNMDIEVLPPYLLNLSMYDENMFHFEEISLINESIISSQISVGIWDRENGNYIKNTNIELSYVENVLYHYIYPFDTISEWENYLLDEQMQSSSDTTFTLSNLYFTYKYTPTNNSLGLLIIEYQVEISTSLLFSYEEIYEGDRNLEVNLIKKSEFQNYVQKINLSDLFNIISLFLLLVLVIYIVKKRKIIWRKING